MSLTSPLPQITSLPVVGPVVGRVMENPRVQSVIAHPYVQNTVNTVQPYVQPVMARAMPLVQNTVNFTQPYVQPVIQRATPVIQSSMGSISAGVGYVQQIPQQAQTHVIQPVMARAVAAREGVISTAQPVIQPVMARATAVRASITAAPGQIYNSAVSTAQPVVSRTVSTVQPYVQPYVQGLAQHRYVQGTVGLAQRVTVTGQAALSAGKAAWQDSAQ